MVLPTDFQQPAQRAFNYAVRLSSVCGARLNIVHVIKTVSESARESPGSRSLNPLKTAALLELGRLTSRARDAGLHAEPHLLFGGPSDSILEFTADCHAGLIVMGTHGRTGWDRLRLGSTAQAVVRGASCPVLTLQEVVARDSYRHHAKVNLGRLLVATDFSPCADAALRYVSGLATGLSAQVCIMHAADEGLADKIAQRKLSMLVRQLQQHGRSAESRSAQGHPVEVILRLAEEWQADMIAVGTQGRRGLSRLLLGSVAESLLRRAGCPVLVVRNRRDGSRR
jgi:nucleotide-binding universal stress UspA family protein